MASRAWDDSAALHTQPPLACSEGQGRVWPLFALSLQIPALSRESLTWEAGGPSEDCEKAQHTQRPEHAREHSRPTLWRAGRYSTRTAQLAPEWGPCSHQEGPEVTQGRPRRPRP